MAGKGGKRSTSFKPGQSGNPAGRKPVTVDGIHVPSLAKEFGPAAIRTLNEIMASTDAPHSARVRAAEALLDRGYGKAPATVNTTVHKAASDLSDAELAAIATGSIRQ